MMRRGGFLSLILLLCLAVLVSAQKRQPPSITEPRTRRQEFVKEGQDVTLQCEADGIPEVVYNWLWNDAPIQSNEINFDANTGTLVISKITTREEGFFTCEAKNTYQGQEVKAISPKIEVRIARVGDFPDDPASPKVYTFNEGNYAKIPCDEKMPVYYGPTTFKWYTPVAGTLIEVQPDERKFIDQEGSLHFAYIEKSDENIGGNREYQCAMSNTIQGLIKLGSEKEVIVNSAGGPIPEKSPAVEYQTSGDLLTVERNKDAHLECVFSGYANAARKVPVVTWFNSANERITTDGKYSIENEGRTLVIKNVVEADEKAYFCKGTLANQEEQAQLLLNVTSSPIWVKPLKSQTVPEGRDAVFDCVARSASGETPPGPPEWYKNGNRMGSSTDPTKYVFSDNNKRMTVKYLNKATDIACFQCHVENSVGREFSDGCLNVIKPITITVQPSSLEQEVSKGDTVNLTVVATSDPITTLEYEWYFKNVTYVKSDAPPHVVFDPVTMLAYINTSELTDEEYAQIDGTYYRKIYHLYQTEWVNVTVTRAEAPPVVPVAAAGFDFWIIGLIIGIIIILIVIIIIICVICRRKMQEGAYPLGKKETDAGLDPEKDLKDSGFHDLSRADFDDYPEKGKPPPGNFDFDDIPIGVDDDDDFEGEYGEEATAFNEDGSFIGVYTKDNRNKPPQPPPYSAGGPTESNV